MPSNENQDVASKTKLKELLRSTAPVDIFSEDIDLDFPLGFIVEVRNTDGIAVDFLGSVFGEFKSALDDQARLDIELAPAFEGFTSTKASYVGSGGVFSRSVLSALPKPDALLHKFVVDRDLYAKCTRVTGRIDFTTTSTPKSEASEQSPDILPTAISHYSRQYWYPVLVNGDFGKGYGVFQFTQQAESVQLLVVHRSNVDLSATNGFLLHRYGQYFGKITREV